MIAPALIVGIPVGSAAVTYGMLWAWSRLARDDDPPARSPGADDEFRESPGWYRRMGLRDPTEPPPFTPRQEERIAQLVRDAGAGSGRRAASVIGVAICATGVVLIAVALVWWGLF